MSLRIGLIGQAGAGKSTVARILSSLIGVPVCSFAKPLKQALENAGITKSKYPLEYRHLAQEIGQTMRNADQHFWVRRALAHDPDRCVYDDVRYENECAICDALFLIVPIGFQPARLTKEAAAHESERLARNPPKDAVVIPNRRHLPRETAEEIFGRLVECGMV